MGPSICTWEILHSDSNLQPWAVLGEAVISRPHPRLQHRVPGHHELQSQQWALAITDPLTWGGGRPTWAETKFGLEASPCVREGCTHHATEKRRVKVGRMGPGFGGRCGERQEACFQEVPKAGPSISVPWLCLGASSPHSLALIDLEVCRRGPILPAAQGVHSNCTAEGTGALPIQPEAEALLTEHVLRGTAISMTGDT